MNWNRQFALFVLLFTLIWGAFILCSCGRAMPAYVNDKTEDVFIPYMEAFGEECSIPYVPIRIGFGLYDEKKAGICMTYSKQEMYPAISGIQNNNQVYEEILINEAWWKQYDTDKRKWLIFHEMGHCALGKVHSDDEEDIMYWQLPVVAVITQEKLERLCQP